MRFILNVLTALFSFSFSAQNIIMQSIPEELKQFNFFLIGECHLKSDYDHRFLLFTELYHKVNVRKIIFEVPQEYEYDINKFISRPESLLEIINLGSITLHNEQEYYKFIVKLKEFNLSIKDSSQRISVICSDVNPILTNALFRLSLIDQIGTTSNNEITNVIKRAGRIGVWGNSKNNSRKIRITYRLKSLLDTYESDFMALYKENFYYVKRAINSLYFNSTVYSKHKFYPDSLREKCMYENIIQVYKEFPNDKYFGNFGMIHLSLIPNENGLISRDWKVFNSLANRLNSTKNTFPLSLLYYYINNDSISNDCGIKFYGEDILTAPEKQYYFTSSNDKYVYISINKLKNHEKLKGIFHGLIISKK